MGRGKVVVKPIDNPSSRKVTFCKRRRGLMKKAHELAVLCDVEVALLLFSTTGKFYHFSSANSIESTVRRYHQHQEAVKPKKVIREAAGKCHKDHADGEQKRESETPLSLLENIKVQELNIYELTQLEQELYTSLSHIIMWKNQLIADSNSSLQKVASSSAQMAENTVPDLLPIDGDAHGSPLRSSIPSNS